MTTLLAIDVSKHQRHLRSIECPTLLVAIIMYGGFGALTWLHTLLPWWLILPLGGYLLAWHGSLQHEVVHGHPTPWAWVNEALIFPSLWLWLPFREYRREHHLHHQVEHLTDPDTDPESNYTTAAAWQAMPAWYQTVLVINGTLLGRLLIGPLLAIVNSFREAIGRLWYKHGNSRKNWLLHLLSCAPVLLWVLWICDIAIGEYLLLYVYPSLSLTLLRSFAEHQPSATRGHRTAIVESNLLLSLVFLNNNLHAVHHSYPQLPWYQIPQRWRQTADTILATNGNYRFNGYRQLFRRYLLTPQYPIVHSGGI